MIKHIDDPNSDNCIVFIHGLGGGSSTFMSFSDYLSRKWNLEFGILLKFFTYYKKIFNINLFKKNIGHNTIRFLISIFTYIPGVLSFIIKAIWSKRNTHNTDLLSKYIEENCFDKKNIILVAHSMGGIIARQYLVKCRKNQVDIRKFKMLVTYATPHKGSHIANYISIKNIPLINSIYLKTSAFLNYRLSPQIGDLSNFSEFIEELDKDWRDFNIEKNVRFLRIIANFDSVVKKESAQLHEDDFENIFDYDYTHSSIIKPKKNNNSFPPIDKFIEQLNTIDLEIDEYYEELEEELDYDSNEDDTY